MYSLRENSEFLLHSIFKVSVNLLTPVYRLVYF